MERYAIFMLILHRRPAMQMTLDLASSIYFSTQCISGLVAESKSPSFCLVHCWVGFRVSVEFISGLIFEF